MANLKWLAPILALFVLAMGTAIVTHYAELSEQRETIRRENSAYWQGMLEGYNLGLSLDEADDSERAAVEQLIAGEFIGGDE